LPCVIIFKGNKQVIHAIKLVLALIKLRRKNEAETGFIAFALQKIYHSINLLAQMFFVQKNI